MAEVTPPLVLQAGSHPADQTRRALIELAWEGGEGVIDLDSGALKVTEKSGTPDMSVDVAAGFGVVAGDTVATQGLYLLENDATVNLAISASDPTNDRIDLVVAQVRDNTVDSGGNNDWRLFVVTGTPAASPSPPALPDSSLQLATVNVGAGVSSITNANIDDDRGRTRMRGEPLITLDANLPSAGTPGRRALITDLGDSGLLFVDNGSIWTPVGGMVKLDEVSPSEGATSFEFTNIPQDFTHLKIVGKVIHDNDSTLNTFRALLIRLNNDSGTDQYAGHVVAFDNTTSAAKSNQRNLGNTSMMCGLVGTSSAGMEMIIPDYTGGSRKSVTNRGDARIDSTVPLGDGDMITWIASGLWNASSAITRITFFVNVENWNAGTELTLYGLA